MSTSTAGGRRPRVPLTRERVLHAAVALADESGSESLSMRKLGEAVGVEAMSLYHHVANKDDLLDGMIDVVFSEIDLSFRGKDWKTAMRRRAVSARHVLARHGWAIGFMESRSSPDRPRCAITTPFSVASAAPASRSSWPGTPSRSSTATSTGSRCRSAACPSTRPRRPPRWRRTSWPASPPTHTRTSPS